MHLISFHQFCHNFGSNVYILSWKLGEVGMEYNQETRERLYVWFQIWIMALLYSTYTTVNQEQSNPGSKKGSPPCLFLDLSMIVRNCVEELFIGDIKSQGLIMCATPRIPYVVLLCH